MNRENSKSELETDQPRPDSVRIPNGYLSLEELEENSKPALFTITKFYRTSLPNKFVGSEMSQIKPEEDNIHRLSTNSSSLEQDIILSFSTIMLGRALSRDDDPLKSIYKVFNEASRGGINISFEEFRKRVIENSDSERPSEDLMSIKEFIENLDYDGKWYKTISQSVDSTKRV